ncbi:hypothetical protein [Microbacterium phyllosphaerae]|uniref:hypothetical protein n=1 Tax=Microbacterium phyllosphaerae TaxID=124798 RepID=UPI000EA3DD7B|nr:hypothetical protein [Microbacterium phyllosphaerae]
MNTAATKTAASIALLALLGFGTVACSAPAESTESKSDSQSAAPEEVEEAPEPVDLTGEWKQTNSNTPESFQSATITGETIEVSWNSTDTKSLYWAGTVTVPENAATSFTFDSVNDTSKTDSAMLASSDPTKTFTYADGELSYEVTALGTTMTVRLEKQ